MSDRRTSTRQRLIQVAVDLFITQGVAETTTRQIAEQAGVNEVTLFRHFGNKHGLLLAVMQDKEALSRLGMALGQQSTQMGSASQAIKDYANVHLQALEQIQEFVRSLIGEAGHYPDENRRALGRGLLQANRYTAQYLATIMEHEQLQTCLPTEKLASLLNSMLLGYAVLEFTSEFNNLWPSRESFIEALVELFMYGAIAQPPTASTPPTAPPPAAPPPAAPPNAPTKRPSSVNLTHPSEKP
ncbi:TetR/AcrR family transcriptional regulator [Thermoleptolyngbya oregonensis NK1-22]|uniref:TetR/AcrR family transcriptional regulator n=1 Tax=Thermoleptolyngbya oregonensis NK1-22 TaxID=2547457 RepID=A0AA97BEC8_9CYAN|nr:TetR/AcrR family transcriptional regulator [Thermoleptolyngbya oregonensis]WOB45446.1 TetR/AcrR family transcriptional regulator [Thermoleptolyngbya oregonensis NK1-22]